MGVVSGLLLAALKLLGEQTTLVLSGQGTEVKDGAREKAREEALKRLEEEAKKPAAERRLPEFGSDDDFQLRQALNQLKGQPVQASKTLTERPADKAEK
jgi:carboxyl-terminal processing protease